MMVGIDWNQIFGRKRQRKTDGRSMKKIALSNINGLKNVAHKLKQIGASEAYLIGSSAKDIKRDELSIDSPTLEKDVDVFVILPNIKINTDWVTKDTPEGEVIKVGQFKDEKTKELHKALWPYISSGFDFFIKDKSNTIWQSLVTGGFRKNPIKIKYKIKLR